ncbi:MAG: hypothetical protein B7X97_02620 [Methylotenera sp. 17-45-7]|jgi:hypothetical protein|nr:MAG: hypothetical protein B7X97_02620 [Methylotenera sp. 17-45-7]HQS44747.1 phage tail protein [Methylotenera sp.]
MDKPNKSLDPHVIDKGLTISKYKGVYQAKRIMMKAGLDVEVINQVLSQDKNLAEKNSEKI